MLDRVRRLSDTKQGLVVVGTLSLIVISILLVIEAIV